LIPDLPDSTATAQLPGLFFYFFFDAMTRSRPYGSFIGR
jgi:hypothetical protein